MLEDYPLFVLTMRGDETRRAPLVHWLEAKGIEYELLFGVDGRKGLGSEWEASIDRDRAEEKMGRAMGDSEFACALSHQEAYRIVLERDLPGAVVLEDDAVPNEAFARFLSMRGYLQAEMILLDHSNTRVSRTTVDLGSGFVGHRVVMSPFLATGYSVSAKAAAQIREMSLPISFVPDWPCDISKVGAIAVMPRPVGHVQPTLDHSHLEHDRQVRQRRFRRFLTGAYWLRWWRKHTAMRLPDAE